MRLFFRNFVATTYLVVIIYYVADGIRRIN